jgi:hypothetical protein
MLLEPDSQSRGKVMARIRTVKPEFWTDETLAECSMSARLLFIASLNFADDNGNLERSARQLKAQAFPYDSIDCEPLVRELIAAGLVVEYKVGERMYLHIKGFLTHQKIDRPSKCRIPVRDESTTNSRILDEPSTSPRSVREGSLVEGIGRESKLRAEIAPRETESEIHQHVEDIKAIYPKAARADWITAEKLMRNLVRDGTPWELIDSGVTRYAAYCKATNRLVQNPALWFGAIDRPWLQEWELPKNKAEARLDSNVDVMQQFIAGGK